jgi:hypothetical protein
MLSTNNKNALNEAKLAADDVAGALALLSHLFGTLAAKDRADGHDKKMLEATFSTLQARAEQVAALLNEALAG